MFVIIFQRCCSTVTVVNYNFQNMLLAVFIMFFYVHCNDALMDVQKMLLVDVFRIYRDLHIIAYKVLALRNEPK